MNRHKFRRTFLQFILAIILMASGMPLLAQAPTVTTGAATGIGATGATLNGTVNANGLPTVVFFEYGLTDEYGQSVPGVPSPVSGSTAVPVTGTLILLDPLTTYHYRVGATNASGTTYGADMTFTTTAPTGSPPLVITDSATGIGVDFATLNGRVHTFGVSSTVIFQWGTDTNYGNSVTADQSPVTSSALFPVTASLSSLPNNTTYHYRVVASNINGTTYGPDQTFVIGSVGGPPTVATNAAADIGSITATLNGTVNANGDSTTVTFEYGTSMAFGSTVAANPSPVSGTTNTPVSVVINTFIPNTTYYYRVVGTNSFGTGNGTAMSFTTLPSSPTAVTDAASAITSTSATLNGTINANGASTAVTFEYGPTIAYGTVVTADQSPVSGSVNTAVSKGISGLTNGITYHYRVIATNAGGTTIGADMTFTAGVQPPTATTNAASGIGSTSATLNGTVNANNSDTTVTFEYGETTGYGRTALAVQNPVTGSASTAVNAAVSGLAPATLYHFRVKAESAGGTTYGVDMTFSTLAAPTVTTNAASAVTTSGATLNGTVNANGSSTAVTFEYGTTPAYGSTVTADQSPVTGSTDTAVSKAITGLTPNTTYHYRVNGQNANGTTYGADMTFVTTVGAAPIVTTNAATAVLFNGATLNGTVTANNSSTTVTFEYGTSIVYGTTVTADQSPVTGVGVSVSKTITGLANNTTYHYRVVGTNANGTNNGADMTFTTSFNPTVQADPATNVLTTSATLNGTVNANYMGYTVIFEYSTDLSYSNSLFATPSYVGGNIDTPVSANITGLTPNTLYNYRVNADNSITPYYSSNMTFTTSTGPTVTTNAASAVGSTSATLNGTINANNSSTNATFEFGETTGYGRTVTADQSPVTGSIDTAVSATPTDLLPNTTYHYRAVGTNIEGPIYGADMTFITGSSPPTADTTSATAVTMTGATLNGIVNANNDSTTVTFEYGLTPALGSTVTADQSPVSGNANTAVSKAITGLLPNTTYYFRVSAQNASGTTYGVTMSFFTGTSAPTATTLAATTIGSTGATLNGTINANNASTTVTFEYGETTGYGRTATASPSPVSGSTDTAVSADITGLTPNTLYHYRVVGQNASGTSNGADMTFTTNAANTPTVSTANVTNIAASSATSGGNVTDEGGAPVTARGVCWSTVTAPTTADSLTVDGAGPGAFTSNLTGLTELTVYYVRAYATNIYGTAYGPEFLFATNAANTPTVTTKIVTEITADSARSGGNVIDNGGAAVTARGVCWSTAPNPTIANNRTSNGTGTGAFTSYLINLSENTTYYVRAYATNAVGTAYGGQRQFTGKTAVVNVTITEPGQGETVSGTVTIAASASIGSARTSEAGHTMALSIAKVGFYIDDIIIGTDTTEPYETQWDTTTASNGSHSIKAVAYDSNDNTAQDEITVTVNNIIGPTEIILNRTNLNYGSIYQAGSTMGDSVTTDPQTVLINYSGGGTLNWAISKDADWLSFSPGSGQGPGIFTVSVDPSGLDVGTYSASITVTDINTSNGKVLPVNLTVYKKNTTSAPFGHFAAPINNAEVMSSIPVTGWVLDDIQVTDVKIYRARVHGEGGNKMVYIGDAVFVDGARPDVEETYPYYPLNYQAGWGYMMLTNFLPNQGNGTFTIYAKATDKEGKTVTLGSKTIHCDNANAVKPFGAIDTPDQGGVASGKSFVNFGWALTPLPNTIPIDGSTILVWVDGVPLGSPVYNQYRSDIEDLFPGYNNSSAAGGYFYLDTAKYTNGVHTISWSAKDNAGNVDGIGSRYFTIVNTDSSSTLETENSSTGMTGNINPLSSEFFQLIKPMGKNIREIGSFTIKELEYVALRVADKNQSVVRGFLEMNDRLNPLPIGSTLDTKNGIFFWHPGPGFFGRYNLVFVIESPNGHSYKKPITITIEPK